MDGVRSNRPRSPTRTRPRFFRSAANLPPPLTPSPPPPFAATDSPAPFAMPASRQFDHEKLQVYQLELEFIAWLTDLFAEVQAAKVPRLAEVLDQLDRASLSALLNTAEGNGRRASQQRVKFFDDARGSSTECAACLDALVAKRACKKERILDGKDMLLSIVSILSALISRFEKPQATTTRSPGGGVRVGGRGGLTKP